VIYLVLLLAVVLQSFAGLALWRWLRPVAGWVELVGMSLVLGTLLAALFGIVFQPVFGFGWALPGVAGLLWWVFVLRRHSRVKSFSGIDWPLLSSLVIGGVLAAFSFGLSVRSYPLNWEGSWSGFHGDMAFFEALGRSIPTLGVFDSIFTPGQAIHYHWLTYAWTGQMTTSFNVEPFLVLTRVLPVVTLIAGVTLIAAWTRRLSRVRWAPSLAVILLLLGGHLGVVYGSVFNFDSPSQSLSAVWLIGFVLVVLNAWEKDLVRSRFVVSLVVIALFSAGFILVKVSTAAVAAAVIAGLVVFVLIRGGLSRRLIALVIVSAVPMVAAYFVFIAGGNGGGGIAVGSLLDRASSEQGMNPVIGIIGVALGTGILAIGIGVRWVGTLWLMGDSHWRTRPELGIGLGLVVVGVGSALLLNGGQNELWFAAAAAGPLAALSAVGAGNAWEFVCSRVDRSRMVISVGVIAASVLVFAVVWVLWATGPSGGNVWEPTLRWLGPIAGVVIAVALSFLFSRNFTVALGVFVLIATLATAPGRMLGIGTGQVGLPPTVRSEFFSPPELATPFLDQEFVNSIPASYLRAGESIRNSSSPGDRVVTNLTYSTIVPALTGLQTVVSGTWYQLPYGPAGGAELLLEREAVSYAFINEPSDETIAPLCELGVRWVWIDPARTQNVDWAGFMSVSFEDERVIIGELDPGLC
jgi:hypothetical protein